jgi:hypothetical protein
MYRRLILSISLLLALAAPGQGQDNILSEAGLGYIHPKGSNRTSAPASNDAMATGVFHNGSTLVCSHCHIMHASQQHLHDNQTFQEVWGGYPRTFSLTEMMLKSPDPISLCLTCHDGQPGIPDVVGADVNGLTDRSGGYFDVPNTDNPRGHKLEFGLSTNGGFDLCMRCHFGGTFETAAVTCIDCHNPHGNYKARNLQWASSPGGEPELGLFVSAGATGLAKYERENVRYGTSDDATNREVTNICLDCHHVLTGATYNRPDGSDIHSLHPSYDSERGDPNTIDQGETDGTSAPAHWESGTGAGFFDTQRLRWVTREATDFGSADVIDASRNGVFCLSCHRAHGGEHSFALLYDPTDPISGEGCDQCHYKTGLDAVP